MQSIISPNSKIHSSAWINPENVSIEEGVSIGPNCCIGTTGLAVEKEFFIFGNNQLKEAEGQLIIKKNSQIFALCVIELAQNKNDTTVIGQNVIIGPQNGIGHDTVICDNTILVSGINIMGHVKIGKNCWIGPGAVIRNRIEIGDNAFISMGSIVTQNVEKGKQVTGNFAVDHKQFIKNLKKTLE